MNNPDANNLTATFDSLSRLLLADDVPDGKTEVTDDDLTAEIAKLRAPEPVKLSEQPHVIVPVEDYDQLSNLLDDRVMNAFLSEVFDETEEDRPLSAPAITTITMEGMMSNVRFHEAELIQELHTDVDLVDIHCNYGRITYPGYHLPVKKATKLNKKRELREQQQARRPRKVQGNGTDFNSQITFVIRSEARSGELRLRDDGYYDVPADTPVYLFKVFRTGKIQLPGVRPEFMQDVFAAARKIANVLNLHLHAGETDPSKCAELVNMNPVMKNYKFVARLEPGMIIDLTLLRAILNERKKGDCARFIYDIRYTREDTKLSIKFRTPIFRDTAKKTRVNIYMRGKINILGANDIHATRRLFALLEEIMAQPDVFVKTVHYSRRLTAEELAENIGDPPADYLDALMNEVYPRLSEEDYEEIMQFIAGL